MKNNAAVIDVTQGMVERAPSNASSVQTVHNTSRPQTASRIYFSESPPIDLEECRAQLKLQNVALPENIDPEMLGKPDDYLDGRNEECFVLDSFNALIQSARNAKKDLIVARVMTVDPTDPTRSYWSYYSAHQINKVMFRTETGRNLLHKVRCLNPLNNMLIVGPVNYFIIDCEEVDRAHSVYEQETGEKVHCLLARNTSCSSLLDVDKKTYPLPVLAKSISYSNLSVGSDLFVEPVQQPNTSTSINPQTPSSNRKSHITYNARYIGSDEDFLQRKNFRDMFMLNTLNPGDAELFPLNPEPQHIRVVVGPAGQQVQIAREPPQVPGWTNLGGMIYWPPRSSVLISGTGILNEWSFAVIALVSIGLTVGLGLILLPIWGLLVGGPLCAAALAVMAFTSVHFRE